MQGVRAAVTRTSTFWKWVAGASAALCVAAPLPAQHQVAQDVTLHGQVQTKDGRGISEGVMVTLQTSDGAPVATLQPDWNGNFEFSGLLATVYTLSAKAEKYQNFQQTLDFTDARVTYHTFNIVLAPLEKPAVNPATLPTLTDQAAPKSARKEFEKGSRAWRENKTAEARNHLEKAVEEYPCYARAQAALAGVEQAAHNMASAEAGYKRAIHCDGTYSDAFYQLAQLYMEERKPADSEAILREALRLSPNAWLFHYQLGNAQLVLGKSREASQDFLTAQSLHPEMPPEFHIKLANAYLKMAEYSKALTEIDTYLRLNPQGPYTASAKKVAEKLRSGGINEAAPQAEMPSTAKP
jgi:tetratricopeptide (TPR) repeat protein